MLQIANVDLIVPTARFEVSNLEAWVQANIPQDASMPWLSRAFPGQRLQQIAIRTGFRPASAIRLNRWWTSWGASRFGHGHFLASTSQAAKIREECLGDKDAGKVKLKISSPGLSVEGAYETDVYVLAITPLGRIDPIATTVGEFENGLYLVTVVDERYYWWYRQWPARSGSEAASWEDLYATCGEALGKEIAAEAVPTDYLLADPSLAYLEGEPIPPILDAIAMNVGQRVVLHADGTVKTYGAQKAKEARDEAMKAWTIRAGGDRFREQL